MVDSLYSTIKGSKNNWSIGKVAFSGTDKVRAGNKNNWDWVIPTTSMTELVPQMILRNPGSFQNYDAQFPMDLAKPVEIQWVQGGREQELFFNPSLSSLSPEWVKHENFGAEVTKYDGYTKNRINDTAGNWSWAANGQGYKQDKSIRYRLPFVKLSDISHLNTSITWKRVQGQTTDYLKSSVNVVAIVNTLMAEFWIFNPFYPQTTTYPILEVSVIWHRMVSPIGSTSYSYTPDSFYADPMTTFKLAQWTIGDTDPVYNWRTETVDLYPYITNALSHWNLNIADYYLGRFDVGCEGIYTDTSINIDTISCLVS